MEELIICWATPPRAWTQAFALDPLNPAILENKALLIAFQGDFKKAIEQLTEYAQRAVELAPQSPVALSSLLDSYLRPGQLDQAHSVLTRMLEIAPNNEIANIAVTLAERALAQGWGGSQLDYALASVAASVDYSNRALDHLRDAIEAGWSEFVRANQDPTMVDLVQLSEFIALSK